MALNDDIAVLLRQPLLGLMEHDALRLLAFAAETRVLRAGDMLFQRDEPADCAYLVLSGTIALLPRDDGGPAEQLATLGTLIGEMALFTATRRPTSAVAREPARVMTLTRRVMHRVLNESPQSARAVATAIATQLRSFVGELSRVGETLTAIDARSRRRDEAGPRA